MEILKIGESRLAYGENQEGQVSTINKAFSKRFSRRNFFYRLVSSIRMEKQK